MRRLLRPLVLGLTLLATPTLAATPTHLWDRSFGAVNSDVVTGVAVDPAGNVIIVGYFIGTVNVGGGDLTSAGSNDILIAKFTPEGAHLWSKRFGSTGSDVANGVALDVTGSIFVTGSFTLTVDFGDGIGLVGAGSNDIFLAKYGSNGQLAWSKRFGAASSDLGKAVAVDAGNNVLLLAEFQATVDFGSGVGLISAGSGDVALAKYNTIGTHVWSKSFGSTGTEFANGIDCDASSNVLITGSFVNTINFGGSNLVSAGGNDIYVAKFNSSGTHQWSQRYGAAGADAGSAVATDSSGNVILDGVFASTVNFGGSNLISAGNLDMFLAKYTTLGVHQWSQRFGAASQDEPTTVAVDASDNVLMGGLFAGNVNFGGGLLINSGSADIVLARYSPAGAHQWSQRFGGTATDIANVVCVDAAGNLAMGGYFSAAVDFGGGTRLSGGGTDGWVAKFDPRAAEPDITGITDIGNDQGRKVQIKFVASGGDNTDAEAPITSYEAYRKQKAPPAAAGGSQPQLLSGWTFVASVPAHQESDYTIEAPTIGDTSVLLGTYNSVFFIRAASDGNLFYDSPPDSGASVDNLSPGVPSNFVYASGNLTWDESDAEDFNYFTVYGGSTNSFGAATLVDYSVAPGMNVSGSPYVFYFVTATDFNGNEGKPAIVNSLSGVGGTPSSYVLSVSNYPNPFNPRTTVNYTVPSRGTVSVRVFDAHGALVATLFDGERNAGAYSIDWDGRTTDAAGAASGVYFARIEHNGATRTKKMVLLK